MTTSTSSPRGGFILIGLLVVLALVGLSAGTLSVAHIEGHRAFGQRLVRIQARELALAAAALPANSQRREGPWLLEHQISEGNSILSATSPRGRYIIKATDETWQPQRGRP